MKKLFSLFVPLMALLLTLSPQTAKADNMTEPFTIKPTNGKYVQVYMNFVGTDWNDTEIAKVHILSEFVSNNNGSTSSRTAVNIIKLKTAVNATDGTIKYVVYWKNSSGGTSQNLNLLESATKYLKIYCSLDDNLTLTSTKFIQIDVKSSVSGATGSMSGNIMSLVHGTSFSDKTAMTHDYQFYHLFSPTGVNTSNTNFVTWDASNLVLPATELTNHCYEGMFSALGNKVAKGPQIMALNPESNCASACFKNMFNGCTAMTELTTYFLTWGSGSGTETWLPANWSGTFKGTSDLAAEGSHTGASGTGNASITQSVSPNAYIFKVHDNLITWDGTCYVDKYATTAAPVIADPYGDFDAWYTDKTAGSAVTLSSLAAPSGLIPLYARLVSATNYNVAISAPTNGTITVTYNDGSSQSFTSDNRDIAENTNLTITATPASEDYILTGLTVTPDGDSPIDHTSGEIYRLESDITIAATFARAYTISANGVHGSVTNTGKYAVGSEVSLTAVPDEYYSFVRWSNGETDNPLEITVSEDLNLTAEFAFDYTPTSSAQSANIFQGATNDTTKILYVLASETVGGITYTPKDMGYGVAWSDKNVGASASTDAGSYFYWSGTTAVGTNDNSSRYIGVESESEGYSLPTTKDPAQVNISSAWYMPTKAEWQDLIDNCTWTRVNAGTIQYDLNITNKTDNSITIYLPYTGYKTSNNYGASYGPTAAPPTGRYACYWLNTLYSSSASGILSEYAYSFQADGTNTNGAIIHSHLCYESMPVRPIYKPTFPTCKLTINVGSKSYVYVCELGQSITITAKPTVVGNGFLRWNEDGNTQATRTFVPQGDETYTAIFGELTTYAITYNAGANGTGSIAAESKIHGVDFTLSSSTFSRTGYTQTGWSLTDGGGKAYELGDTYTTDAVLNLYPFWTANTYYVSFAANGGSGTMTDQTFTYGVAQTLKPNAFTGPAVTVTYNYNGATGGTSPASETVNASFYMWTDGSGVNFYEDKESVSNLTATNGATVALTAIWNFDQEVTLPSPTKTGYTFVQWESGEEPLILIAGEAGEGYAPDEDVTLNAHWNAINYTITYNGLNDASNSNPATYTIETATFALANPGTRAGYTFTGWTCGGNSITQITIGSTGDKTITANWSTNTHNVSWVTDGNALTGTYTTGTTAYGTTIVAPATPTKNATAEYTYAFNGWSPTPAATMPDNDVTYTAQWTETPVNYTLTWDFDGGSTATAVGDYTNGTVAYGTTIVAPADPTKEGCTFNGWDVTPAGTMPAANTTYTAQWTACATELHIVLDEHAEDGDDYYDDFQKYNGVTATTVTLNRQFGQGKWATLCLPFEVSPGQMTNLRMKGRVYEFRHATGNANDGNQVTLFFAQAEKLTAGKAYIVNANAKLAELTQFVFHNVTINTSADQIKPLNSISQYNDLADMVGYSDGTGTIQLVGTLRLGTLKGSNSGNTYMGLKDNKIYYPSTSEPGSTVWAYRGVFRSTTPLGAQRIRIVVEGEEAEEVTELEVINGELQQAGAAKKFVQDGVLYIEREGVIYDAQGKLIVEN